MKRSHAVGKSAHRRQLAACAATFQAIVSNANPFSDPAWVNYFLPQNQQKGYPVAIGEHAHLTANGVNGPCQLTFEDPTQSALGTAYFMPGHTAFDGSTTAPVYTPAQGTQPTPNVQIGPYGQLTYLTNGAPVAGAEARVPSPPNQTGPSSSPTTTASNPPTSTAPTSNTNQRCGTVTGGGDTYKGQLTVYAGAGVSCATATRVIADLSAGKAQNHQGQDVATSYFSVDGWRCSYGNMDSQGCSKGSLQILVHAPPQP